MISVSEPPRWALRGVTHSCVEEATLMPAKWSQLHRVGGTAAN